MFANSTTTMLEIVFESVQQKHLDKTIFHHASCGFCPGKASQTSIVPICTHTLD